MFMENGWSTTTRHINYVADELNLTKVNSSEYNDTATDRTLKN